MNRPFVLLDDAPRARLRIFTDPVEVVSANDSEQIPVALQSIERLISRGMHVVGYFSYELGYGLEPKLRSAMPPNREHPLLWFGAFPFVNEISGDGTEDWFDRNVTGRAYASPLCVHPTLESYLSRFRAVQEYIRSGDIYQANLTFPAHFTFLGDPLALYRRLRRHSNARYGAYICDGDRTILSLSPELFFSLTDNVITARPMKGTAARSSDPDDDQNLRTTLQHSVKDRAENLMIVDLIRNDVSRIATVGSVHADELFSIETYPTVHQMVSSVQGTLVPGCSPDDIIRSMFPCGSITGAPKIRAMEIIREVECQPRGVYCGAIGEFAPNGNALFNVAIRTMTIANGTGTIGIGSGVVADSRGGDEFSECLLKARFFNAERPEISLLETMHFAPQTGLARMHMHLARLTRSAAALGISCDLEDIDKRLGAVLDSQTDPARMRLELAENGALNIFASPAPIAAERPWTFAMAERRVQSSDALSRHKTTWRTELDQEFVRLHAKTGCDQVIFLNERGEVVEGNITNVFLRFRGRLVTPPLSSGCLDGVLRRALLDSGECSESVVHPANLWTAQVYFGNSLRGLIPAEPLPV